MFAARRMGRLGLLLALVLVLAGCGPAATATLAPTPSPTLPATTVREATPTPPPPSATASPAPATEAPTTSFTPTAPPASSATPPPASPTTAPALEAIYSYLEARARADVAGVSALACQAFQGQAATEAVSFRSMQAKLQDVVCQVTGLSGPYTLVGCGGKIITTYGTETREWDLSTFIYQAVEEEGAWKMCGYN